MVTSEIKEQENLQAQTKDSYFGLVSKFLIVWVLFTTLLALTIAFTNLNWARAPIEQMLSQSLSRKVKLGYITWTFGLNGLAIATDKISLTTNDGQPFIVSQRSKIGIAFIPLFQRKLVIRYIALKEPEIWAIRNNDGVWNFADWLKPGPDIRFIEIDYGTLYLQDKSLSSNKFPPYRFNDIRLKLTWPRPHHKWPFYLACKMPRPGYTTELALTIFGKDDFSKWQANDNTFHFSATDLNPQDLVCLDKRFAEMSGLYKLKITGHGIYTKGAQIEAEGSIKNMLLPAFKLGILKAPLAIFKTNFKADPDKLSWDNTSLALGNLAVHSEGVHVWPKQGKNGTTVFDVRINEGNNDSLLSPSESFSIVGLAKRGSQHIFSWLQALFVQPELSKKQKAIAEKNNAGIEITGLWDKNKESTLVKFIGFPINLSSFANHIICDPKIIPPALKNISNLLHSELSLGGYVNLTGQSLTENNKQILKMRGELDDVSLQAKDNSLSATHLSGHVDYDGSNLKLTKIDGQLDGSNFELSGDIPFTKGLNYNLVFNSKSIDLSQLGSSFKLLNIPFPILANHELYGKAQEMQIEINGPFDQPLYDVSIIPTDLYYQPAGLSKPLNATAGNISYDNDSLSLKDVTLVIHGNKLTCSADIDHLSNNANVSFLKFKTYGIELGDLHYFLSSSLIPITLGKVYSDFANSNNLSTASGKIYGHLVYQNKPNNDYGLECVVGFYNTAFHAGPKNWPFDHGSGLLAVSGPEMVLQELKGQVANCNFVLNGHISNYRSENAKWQTDIKTQLYPDQLMHLMPDLQNELPFKITSSGPLSVKALLKGKGTNNIENIVFSIKSDPNNHLRLSNQQITLNQPSNQALAADGSLTITSGSSGSMQINNAHLMIGESIFQAKGKYNWFAPNEKTIPILDAELNSVNPLPAATLISIISPTSKLDEATGSVSCQLSGAGPLNNLTSCGYLSFDHFCLPDFNLYNFTGKIETPGWSFDSSDLTKAATSNSMARIQIDTVRIGTLIVQNAGAKIAFISSEDNAKKHIVYLQDGTAKVADGTLDASGLADLDLHKYNIKASISKVKSSEISEELCGHAQEISGLADCQLTLDTEGLNSNELLSNINGSGTISLQNGKVTRFGPLQEKLTQANLVHSGLLGFNLNNLLQSMVPVRTGKYKDLKAIFLINHGIVDLKKLKFNGDDMQLDAKGTINLPLHTVSIETVGNVPRVSTSMIGGTIGEVSRGISIQKIMSVLTMHKLECLPSLPILGNLADDRPRAFTFSINSHFDNGHDVVQSIEKSFHWLPNEPNAPIRVLK